MQPNNNEAFTFSEIINEISTEFMIFIDVSSPQQDSSSGFLCKGRVSDLNEVLILVFRVSWVSVRVECLIKFKLDFNVKNSLFICNIVIHISVKFVLLI